MKRLLPLLTLALLGAATTASAENFYYEYYKRPTPILSEEVTTVKLTDEAFYPNNPEYWGEPWTQNARPSYQYDTIEYKNDKEGVDYTITRNSNWNTDLVGNKDNFYRIDIKASDESPTTLYLTDYVDNVGSSKNVNAIYYAMDEDDIANGLTKQAVTEYGYRVLVQDSAGKYVAVPDSLTTKTLSIDKNGIPVITDETGSRNASIIDSLYYEKSYQGENGETVDASYYVDRYKYELGTFTQDTVIELYMKDSTGGDVYSYSGFNEGDEYGEEAVKAMGGFGDGDRIVMKTDEMLNGYYYLDENLEKAGLPGFGGDTVEAKAARESASAKSMPLSALEPSLQNRIYFGIIATSAGFYTINDDSHKIGGNGAPLPGGIQLALIAGLFGLGFCYVRRRKATVA